MRLRSAASHVALTLVALPLPGGAVSGQARLEVLDSIRLEQTADVFLGLPTTIYADSTGYLVVDAQQPYVLRYDAAGAFIRRYGREGEAPGEFQNAVAAAPYGPSGIIVFSSAPPAAQIFDRATGAFLERFRLRPPIEQVLPSTGRVWIGGPRYSTGTGLRYLMLGEDRETDLAPLPAGFVEGGPLGGIFPSVSFAVWSDTVLVGFEPSNDLILLHQDGTVLDTISVPVQRRRGVPAEPQRRILEAMRVGPYAEVFGVLSALRAVHRNRDGSTTLVHYDHHPDGLPVTSQVFVTVLSSDRRRACVDAPVPLHPEAQPAIGFNGDALIVLEQVIDGLDAVPILKRLEVDVSECAWVDVP